MGRIMGKILLMFLILSSLFLAPLMTADVEALEPKLLWKKEFKAEINSLDLATESGHVILSVNGRQVFLFDKDGNERFHWGPTIDRGAGRVSISRDGKYFTFMSGYTEEYAYKNNIHWSADDRVHFYDGKTKRELWNMKIEGSPLIFPDGVSLIIYKLSGGNFSIFNHQGKKIFSHTQPLGLPSFMISSDSSHFAFVRDSMQPLTLYKRDGTKVWEKGRHNIVASISEGASYISTFPYTLGPSYTADPQNTHKGIVYEKNGNIVIEGFGILSGDGRKVAMLYPEKVLVMSLPDKKVLKEILVNMREIFTVSGVSHTLLSKDGRYIFLKSGASITVYDLLNGSKNEIVIPNLGKYPTFMIAESGKLLSVSPDYPGNHQLYFYQIY